MYAPLTETMFGLSRRSILARAMLLYVGLGLAGCERRWSWLRAQRPSVLLRPNATRWCWLPWHQEVAWSTHSHERHNGIVATPLVFTDTFDLLGKVRSVSLEERMRIGSMVRALALSALKAIHGELSRGESQLQGFKTMSKLSDLLLT